MRNTLLFVLGILLASWFALTGWFWVYLVNLVYSYPAAIFAMVCWLIIRDDKRKRNFFIPAITGVGLLISLFVLTYIVIAY
jgi:hypothetical protein